MKEVLKRRVPSGDLRQADLERSVRGRDPARHGRQPISQYSLHELITSSTTLIRMKKGYKVSYWCCLLLLLVRMTTGCKTERDHHTSEALQEKKIEPIKPRVWRLLPVEEARPVSLAGAKVYGTLNNKDREKLAILIGRISWISSRVKIIETFCDDFVLAAKFYTERNIIFCSKNADHEWDVVTIGHFGP